MTSFTPSRHCPLRRAARHPEGGQPDPLAGEDHVCLGTGGACRPCVATCARRCARARKEAELQAALTEAVEGSSL